MKKYINCLFAISMLLCSCRNEKSKIKTVTENDFPEYLNLKEDILRTKEMLNIRNFFVQDSFLIINNSRKDSLFMIFDLNTLDCVTSWGLKGKGPGEYGTFTHLMNISSEKFQVADFSRYLIQTYSIPEFKLVDEQKISNDRLENQLKEIPQKILTTDGLLYFYDNFIGNELLLTKWENGYPPIVINRFDSFKEKYKSSLTSWGSMALNRKLDRIVYAYHYFRRFDIINFQGEIIKTVEITPSTPEPIEHGRNLDIENSVLCYMGAKAFKDSFFLYFLGRSQKEMLNKEIPIHCYIEEYDWNGNPIKRYELNKYISDFEIIPSKEDLMYFVGIDPSNEHPLIIFKGKK